MGEAGVAEKPKLFGTIEVGRGIAALMVVLYHLDVAFRSPKYWNQPIFDGLFSMGFSGVEFFFVLSGFIIAQVHFADIGRPERFQRYASRRFLRIYPVYWIVLAGMMLLLILPLGFGEPPSIGIALQSIALIGPDSDATVLMVAWTLFQEIAFYTVFGLLILNVRFGLVIVAAWVALVLAEMAGFSIGVLPAYLASPLNLLFLFGLVACLASRSGGLPMPGLWTVVGIAGFVMVWADGLSGQMLSKTPQALAFGLAAAVGLAAVTTLERRRPVAVPRLALAMGAASYSIYLVHAPLISFMAKVAAATGLRESVPPAVSFVVMFLVAVGASYAFHRVVEKPMLRIGAKLLATGPLKVQPQGDTLGWRKGLVSGLPGWHGREVSVGSILNYGRYGAFTCAMIL